MQRLVGIGAALGIVAAFVSWLGDDEEFCALSRDDGLVAGRHESPDERQEYRERLDEAAEVAPAGVADDVEALRDAADARLGAAAVRARSLADERSSVDAWVGENC